MGQGIVVECDSCHYATSFQLGIGMAYACLENVKGAIHYTRRDEIMGIMHSHDVQGCEYYHGLFSCPKCHGLYERFYVRIAYDGSKVYESTFGCPRCKTELDEQKEPFDVCDWPCPSCGSKALSVTAHMLWD